MPAIQYKHEAININFKNKMSVEWARIRCAINEDAATLADQPIAKANAAWVNNFRETKKKQIAELVLNGTISYSKEKGKRIVTFKDGSTANF